MSVIIIDSLESIAFMATDDKTDAGFKTVARQVGRPFAVLSVLTNC